MDMEDSMQSDRIGRPVRITSISFSNRSLEEISDIVDKEGKKGADIIVLPETWRGSESEPETLEGIAVTTVAKLAKKHSTYIVCPIYRKDESRERINSSVLIDRNGEIACVYDKAFPYWSEFELTPPCSAGADAPVYETDFGRIGMAICFDANFPEVWKRLADQGADLVLWPSAYSAGTTLQAHALNHHFYIVTSTLAGDCSVFDITGKEIFYKKESGINISRMTFDLDRCIFHENFNIEKRDKLLEKYRGIIEQELHMEREQWFVLKAVQPGISAREVAHSYGMEELRDYKDRSRREIDRTRGWPFVNKTF
jgi:predicted amidohydrolase